jgi:hypothetical protein
LSLFVTDELDNSPVMVKVFASVHPDRDPRSPSAPLGLIAGPGAARRDSLAGEGSGPPTPTDCGALGSPTRPAPGSPRGG